MRRNSCTHANTHLPTNMPTYIRQPSERFSVSQLMPNLALKRYIDEFLEVKSVCTLTWRDTVTLTRIGRLRGTAEERV